MDQRIDALTRRVEKLEEEKKALAGELAEAVARLNAHQAVLVALAQCRLQASQFDEQLRAHAETLLASLDDNPISDRSLRAQLAEINLIRNRLRDD
ncbi:hypothetical protein [Burkholderia glumae]